MPDKPQPIPWRVRQTGQESFIVENYYSKHGWVRVSGFYNTRDGAITDNERAD